MASAPVFYTGYIWSESDEAADIYLFWDQESFNKHYLEFLALKEKQDYPPIYVGTIHPDFVAGAALTDDSPVINILFVMPPQNLDKQKVLSIVAEVSHWLSTVYYDIKFPRPDGFL